MKKSYFSVLLATFLLQGCFQTEEPLEDLRDEYPSYGVISDPYIENAVVCEDKNKNLKCDATEQNATASRSDGMFFFNEELTPGSYIILAKQGKHNAKYYTLNLQTTVEDTREVVLTPMTQLKFMGLSAEQIADMLHFAGLQQITQEDVLKDPMEDLNTKTSLQSDEELEKLQASLAIYGMLRILQTSSEFQKMTPQEIYESATTQDEVVSLVLTKMVELIKEGLNKQNFDAYKQQVDTLRSKMPFIPKATLKELIKTATTITDRMIEIGFEAANSYDGTLQQKVQKAFEALDANKESVFQLNSSLALGFLGLENKEDLEGHTIEDENIAQGVLLDDASFIVAKDNKIETLTNKSSAVRVFLEADFNTKPYEDLNAHTCQEMALFEENVTDGPGVKDGLDCNHNFGVSAHATPQALKFAIKSISIEDTNGNVFYLLQKEKLKDSAVFDASQRLELATLDIPNAHYTKIKVEYYYYWYSLEMYKKGNFVHFRVYMSDDDFENEGHNDGERPHHQGDITLTDSTNKELGVIAPGELWDAQHITDIRTEPTPPETKLYASDPDKETNHQRGPFGDTFYWDQPNLNQGSNQDILFYEDDIDLDLNDEVKNITLKFNAKDSWAFEDCALSGVYDTRPIYEIIEACSEYEDFKDINVTQNGINYNCSCNGGWSPELNAPEVVIY